jgi:Na+-transporting NADH:ubiquinone oxidoreductase subunit NqrE
VYFSGSHMCTFLNILTKVSNKIQLALSLINLLLATKSSAADRQ